MKIQMLDGPPTDASDTRIRRTEAGISRKGLSGGPPAEAGYDLGPAHGFPMPVNESINFADGVLKVGRS
jgi:hypothetical protein